MEEIKELEKRLLKAVDSVLVCWELEGNLNMEFISWIYEYSPTVDVPGVSSYLVVLVGYVRKLFMQGFIGKAMVIDEETKATCTEIEILIETGKKMHLRPELKLEKCLEELEIEEYSVE
ncbi:MAG: hypothetical protein DRO15_04850 [Thermoprotei archaeon]|nr:MAG: hypothetical protein DRO15_04850 [Thermoprotei archaeon]